MIHPETAIAAQRAEMPVEAPVETPPPSGPGPADPGPTPVMTRPAGPRRLGLGAPTSSSPSEAGGVGQHSIPTEIRDAIQRTHQTDVGDAVIERGAAASEEARRLDATAFTRDGVVHLPAAAGPLDSPEARGLIAHELTHVAQQRRLGAALPSEDSDEGRRLEAQARMAHQYFRGDAGAPQPQPMERIDRHSMLTTGVAGIDPSGRVSYSGVAPELVQRDALATTTPNYTWQRQWLIDHGYGDELMSTGAGGWLHGASAPTDDPAPVENRHLDDLVQFRVEERAREERLALEQLQRTRFSQAPLLHPDLPAETTADDRAAAALIRAKQDEVVLEARSQAQTAADIQARNAVRTSVDTNYPLHHFERDEGSRLLPLPEQPATPTPTQAQTELVALQARYPELVHRIPDLATGAPTTPTAHAAPPTPASATATGVAPAATHPPAPAAATHTPVAGDPWGGRGATMHPPTGPGAPGAHPGGAGAGPDFSWEASVSMLAAADAAGDRTSAWFGHGMTPEQTAARDLAREHEIGPVLRAERARYLAELVAHKVEEIKRSEFQLGHPALSDEDARKLITAAEWQALIQAVETARPVHTLTDENILLNDPNNSAFRTLVGNAPAARPAPGDPNYPGAAGATGAHGATAAHGATGAQPATHPAALPAAHAAAPAHPVAHAVAAAAAGTAVGAAVAHHEAAHAEAAHPAIQPTELHLNPEQLRRLSADLYVRMRSSLRSELIVDRERAGVLTDFR
jgi:Domain of unknown function (DUF4157)